VTGGLTYKVLNVADNRPGANCIAVSQAGYPGRGTAAEGVLDASRPLRYAHCAMYFQDLILSLQKHWAGLGCIITQPYDLEVGAGTMAPATFLRALGPEPWNVAYVQPSRRPADGRFGENPKPPVPAPPVPGHPQARPQGRAAGSTWTPSAPSGSTRWSTTSASWEDDWESPTLGAWGLGWEVWCDGMEVTQFTLLPAVRRLRVQAGRRGAHLRPGAGSRCTSRTWRASRHRVGQGREVPRGLPRQRSGDCPATRSRSRNPEMLFKLVDLYEAECKRLIDRGTRSRRTTTR